MLLHLEAASRRPQFLIPTEKNLEGGNSSNKYKFGSQYFKREILRCMNFWSSSAQVDLVSSVPSLMSTIIVSQHKPGIPNVDLS